MLHIEGNRECSNMVANTDRGTIIRNISILTFDRMPVPDPGWTKGDGVKGRN